jgi:tetratricopeptide (TPR) repeat protein
MKQVEVSKETLKIPTYMPGEADREAVLEKDFAPRNTDVYPYTTQEVLTGEKELQEYQAVILENDYLKLTFLPELGGRLYSAYDKVNQAEMFYANPVIKPGLFALRGAWPAVGVEFNFPNSHTTTTLEKIFCKTKRYADGSASVILSDIEWTCRMGWSVEVKLHPDKAAIEMESRLYNPTDLPQRFYYWINAACPIYPETQFIYPPSTKRLFAHPPMDASRLGYLDYPLHEGVDISRFENIKQHFPVFAEEMREDFYGIYHHDRARGVVHVADHTLVRGRKLWLFGNARDGRIFIDLLSDAGLDYCELQTGPFSLQSDYRMLEPGRIYVQKDFWLPVAEIGGFNVACREFAANVSQTEIKLYAASKLEKLKLVAVHKNKAMDSATLSIRPGQHKTIKLAAPENAEIHFINNAGETLAVFGNDNSTAQIKAPGIQQITPKNHLRGKYLEEQGRKEEALQVYERDQKNCLESKLAAARLTIEKGLNDAAALKLREILSIDRQNPAALIYYGRILRDKGNFYEAEQLFSRALDANLFRDTALTETAVSCILQKNYRRALFVLEDALNCGTPNPRTLSLYALCKRKLGADNEEYIRKSEELFSCTPLALGEKFFRAGEIPPELNVNPEMLLETACEYLKLGEYEDAAALLASSKVEERQSSYLLVWLKYQLQDKAASLKIIKAAQKMKWHSWFAFRNEFEEVLRYIVRENPEDSTAAYQLGCLLAYRKRWEEALPLWKEVKGREEGRALRNIGLYYWRQAADPDKALKYYMKAVKLPETGSRTVMEAEMLFGEAGKNPERLKLFEQKDTILDKDSRLKLSLVRACLANDMPDKACQILSAGNFCLCEGKMLSRTLYEEAYKKSALEALRNGDLQAAAGFFLKATEYPENIGIGKPAANKEAEWYFKAGKVYEQAGLPEKAEACYRQGAEEGNWLDIDFFPLKNMIAEADWERIDVRYWTNLIYRAVCLKRIKKAQNADKLVSKLEKYLKFLDETGRKDHPDTVALLLKKKLI